MKEAGYQASSFGLTRRSKVKDTQLDCRFAQFLANKLGADIMEQCGF